MKLWVLTGNEENWETAINGNVWGLREKHNLARYWNRLQKGDLLLFYAQSPISGVIGIGETESKFKQDKPLWADEIRKGTVIYPYRFGFKILGIISPERWKIDAVKINDLRVWTRGGINAVTNPSTIGTLLERIKERWDLPESMVSVEAVPVKKEVAEPKKSLHDQIRDELHEIGHLENFISDKEYQLDGERLDVAWRRVVRGVPTKVFEVQVGGSLHQALSKLKHAFDLWNSEPFLIVDDASRAKADELLDGTFHELKPHVKVIPAGRVEELYQSLVAQKTLCKEFGIE